MSEDLGFNSSGLSTTRDWNSAHSAKQGSDTGIFHTGNGAPRIKRARGGKLAVSLLKYLITGLQKHKKQKKWQVPHATVYLSSAILSPFLQSTICSCLIKCQPSPYSPSSPQAGNCHIYICLKNSVSLKWTDLIYGPPGRKTLSCCPWLYAVPIFCTLSRLRKCAPFSPKYLFC